MNIFLSIILVAVLIVLDENINQKKLASIHLHFVRNRHNSTHSLKRD
jgi:hypothetical protein